MLDNTRKTYFSPQDDTLRAFLAFIQSAGHRIRIADYSFNLDPLVDILIAKQKAGVDVQLVLDRSQSAGVSEKPEIKKLDKSQVPFVVGTSSRHKIMHNKFTIVDDAWVQSGSWNYTNAASDEDNFFDIEHSIDRARVFTTDWQKMYDWISQNEPQERYHSMIGQR
ncbi:MAG TPA: phospholipase D-like domain-containing protein [Candidatus Saccharimonadales bacterium]|nr:phospholipase D-like domain-containing protein [Candidatus Saccharimonadales bacterium]